VRRNLAARSTERGLNAVRVHLVRWESEREELETTPEEFIDAGDPGAIVHFRGTRPGKRDRGRCPLLTAGLAE
jgi:hypothetical protein